MKKMSRKLITAISIIAIGTSFVTAYSASSRESVAPIAAAVSTSKVKVKSEVPKYIFLFIGDGMSYPQVQSASYYLGAAESQGKVQAKELSFMKFPVAGSARTFDSTSFCPDSASTATSISTGNKTYSGTINMDTSKTVKYQTIAEQLKKQLGYKIGVLSSVNINHATPAAFYAHQASRNNYYEIGVEMAKSGFDYFAGGALLKPTGSDGKQEDIYEVAKANGYKVIKTQKDAEALTAKDGKAIVVGEQLADSDSLSYNLDRKSSEWSLADYVEKGIQVLNNDKGFFMMVEGGKIDWACHANDAGSSINDTLALNEAVKEAINFYNQHPTETLILVTGDHETGGLSIGYAGTNYDTYLTNLENQKISYAKFDSEYVADYKKNKTDFKKVLGDIKQNFGLITATDEAASSAKNAHMVLSDYEVNLLKEAYERTLTKGSTKQGEMSQREYEMYGTYEPLSVTITHILNNKSGISFTSYSHTGLPVPVFAIGQGCELFEGFYDNTNIYFNIAKLTGVK